MSKTSYLIAFGVAAAAAGWILTGDLEQAKRYYAGTSVDAAKAAVAPEDRTGSTFANAGKTPKVVPSVRVRRLIAEDHTREIEVQGRTDIIEDAELRAETSGKIVSLKATKGQWLKAGDLILRIDMGDRQAQLKRAEARVNYERLQYQGAKKLFNKRFESQVRVAEEEADLAEAEAERAAIKLDIAHTYVRAPRDGYLDTLPVGVGDFLEVADVIGTIINPDPIRAAVQVTEQDVGRMQVGTAATIVTPEGRQVAGEVRFIATQGDEATRTFRVDIWIDNSDHLIRGGQTVKVRVPAGVEKAHKLSPSVLTLDDNGTIGVKVVDRDDIVRFMAARIIADTPDGIWLGGLPEEIMLITVGQEFVAPGQKVRPVPEEGIERRLSGSVSGDGVAGGDATRAGAEGPRP